MFDLKICAFSDLDHIIEYYQPTCIISLIEKIRLLGDNHLHVRVSDIHGPIDGLIHPTEEHLTEILEFTKNLTDDDRVLVHCFAGQSRSTAIGIALLIQHGMDFFDAFEKVGQIRPVYLPNQAFIKLIDDHFNLGGGLIELNENYRKGAFQRTLAPPDAPSKDDIEMMKRLLNIFEE